MGDGVARCSNGELPHYDPDMLASTYLKAEVCFIFILFYFILFLFLFYFFTRIRHFIPAYGPSCGVIGSFRLSP